MELIVILLCAVVLVAWFGLYLTADKSPLDEIAAAVIKSNEQKIEDVYQTIAINRKKMETMTKGQHFVFTLTYNEKDFKKKFAKLSKENAMIAQKGAKAINPYILVGYHLMALLKIDTHTTRWYRDYVEYYANAKNRHNAIAVMRLWVAEAFAMGILYVAACLAISVAISLTGLIQNMMLIGVVLAVAVVIVKWLPFDELKSSNERRQDEINREFANVVAKLALLTGAGMEMSKAWRQVSEDNITTLYLEMQTVVEEVNNGISSYDAYNAFISRCNNKYSTKLGSAIMQNLSKGNAKICELLTEMSTEAWSERREYAKRQGELANSKLMLPMMLMFGGILFLVIAPLMLQM